MRFIVLLVALVLGHGAARDGRAATAPERWFVVSIDRSTVGRYVERTEPTASGTLTTQTTDLALNRLGHQVAMKWSSLTAEDPAGRMRDIRFEMTMSQQTVATRGEVRGDSLYVTSGAGTRVTATGGDPLGPAGVRAITLQRLHAPGDRLVYRMFMPEAGGVVEVTRTVQGRESLDGRSALKVTDQPGALPAQTLWLADDGTMLGMEAQSPFGLMTLVAASRERAMAVRADELPEEMFDRTLARSNVRLPQARALDRLTVLLRHRTPELGWADFTKEHQRVLAADATTRRLEITRPAAPSRRVSLPIRVPDSLAAFLAPNSYANSEDSEVARIAGSVARGGDAWGVALALRDWVSDSLKFDLGVALAPAAEVARNRRGTCAAYTSLLTALCRARGIPARYVVGWVYVDGAWGGHAWTEVRIDDAWLPIDASVPGPGVADAGRIAFATTSLADGGAAAFATGAGLYGHIEIVTERYAYGGREVVVEPAPLSSLAGRRYTNVGTGLSLELPEGFAVVQRDAVWPSDTLLSAVSGEARLAVCQHSIGRADRADSTIARTLRAAAPGGAAGSLRAANRRSAMLAAPSAAAFALEDGLDLWVVSAAGPGAAELLRDVASTTKLPERPRRAGSSTVRAQR